MPGLDSAGHSPRLHPDRQARRRKESPLLEARPSLDGHEANAMSINTKDIERTENTGVPQLAQRCSLPHF